MWCVIVYSFIFQVICIWSRETCLCRRSDGTESPVSFRRFSSTAISVFAIWRRNYKLWSTSVPTWNRPAAWQLQSQSGTKEVIGWTQHDNNEQHNREFMNNVITLKKMILVSLDPNSTLFQFHLWMILNLWLKSRTI